MKKILIVGIVFVTLATILVSSQTGGDSLNITPLCIENWSCTDWSECIAKPEMITISLYICNETTRTCIQIFIPPKGTQTRNCTDSNGCGTEEHKPAETLNCTVNLCKDIICNDSELLCPDGFIATCENSCNNFTKSCSNCTPDCTGHEDLCAGIICQNSTTVCLDGFIATCENTCTEGVCSECTPNYTGHEDDKDNDKVADCFDICPNDPDNDIDNDSICGNLDNCPSNANPNQEDRDQDGIGDICDECPDDSENDIDKDGICGDVDNCPYYPNLFQEDSDNDNVGKICDNCPYTKSNEEVDKYGCSNPQFCIKQGRCGLSCDLADWKNDEPFSLNPHDCITVIVHRGGIPEPMCAGLTCAD